ncbi:methylenetetrahydrofolate reductase [NAD(P)H] [Rhodobacter veldkampii DSM 11550]|uniref:Methylenetetrahydrofolate reductase n=1 Tax=Phaeovulum veldkampii DSM 11550 TaxID=1185920 RepID=A0A2T4JN25_9RHOB|nr:methylenetetrahydrofolate reductase [NAD(P)H] [Phaeovulum veldkampii]MBK5945173.1 methylenetetrahydrofolate reductase [NAD(P)H] [Phaeovulum veldkampii DSM 11550]PTE19312.1 methylenetetrahydrofolate reductase [NAD(P)H] [Phaeovulum veldkampii DSM 11550]TDQ62197.1 5,10-methylenetetrahydrofolate reductase (NAD(P)) [Phaeovulum veldkampii DSM 11550]
MTTPRISFEFFPPQTLDASFRLWETVQVLAPLKPSFVSVTYGAGGTTRQLTHEAVTTIGKNYGLNVAAHLTCVDATRAETMEIVNAYAEAGVREIVALRGDAPKGADRFTPHPEGFASSVELIAALAADGRFTIRCGAYPEPHPDAADPLADVRWLKRKIDAGATSAITQFFFEADTFFRFRDACVKEGITAPIIPGILPIQSWEGAKRFAARCGTRVPPRLDEAFATAKRDGREDLLSLTLCTALCDKLVQGGVEDLHFYTLNRPGLTRDVCHALGVTPDVGLEQVA